MVFLGMGVLWWYYCLVWFGSSVSRVEPLAKFIEHWAESSEQEIQGEGKGVLVTQKCMHKRAQERLKDYMGIRIPYKIAMDFKKCQVIKICCRKEVC